MISHTKNVLVKLDREPRTTTLNSLRGVEGQASAICFGAWKELLKPPWNFPKRVRRPPGDPVNVLLKLFLRQSYALARTIEAGADNVIYAPFLVR
jgi:CRISPR-associated protein Cas1